MAVVAVRIGGKEYHLACDDGQEEHLRLLADEVDERVRDLQFRMGSNPGEALGLLLTAITMADEHVENKKEMKKLSRQVNELYAALDAGEAASSQTHSTTSAAENHRLAQMEQNMALTLEEIAHRIEKIAERIEIK